MARPRTAVLALSLALAAWAVLGGCTTSNLYYGAQSKDLHGKRLLLLRAGRLSPTSEALHERVVRRIHAGVQALEGVGEVMPPEFVLEREGVPLDLVDAYEQFSNTLGLTGIPDPELAHRLREGLGVDLLTVAQPARLPCSVCEEGDQFWLVGQMVDARTGKIVFRAHLSDNTNGDDPETLAVLADELVSDYLEALALAFELRPHRLRFENLKRGASG